MWEYILLSIISAIFFGVANFLQKKGLNQLPTITFESFTKRIFPTIILLIKNVFWISGALVGVLAWFIYVQALNLGDQIVVKPIVNLSLIIIVLLGIINLKEKLRKIEIPLISVIIIGVIFLGYDPRVTGLTEYNQLFLIIAITLLFSIMLILIIFTNKIKRLEVLIPTTAGLAYGISEIFTKLLAISMPEIVVDNFLLRVVYSIPYYLLSPFFWFLAIFTIFGFMIKQSALSQCRISIAIPIINSLSIIIPIIISILIFGEELILMFSGIFIFPYSIFRILGIFLIIIGVILLNYMLKKKECKTEFIHST